jgi:hypothetical protein
MPKFALNKICMNKYFAILIITLLLFACKKKEGCTDPSAINYNNEATLDNGSCNYAPIADLNIHFTQSVGGNPLIIDSMIYTNQGNVNYSIQRLKYLISDITLHTDNGTSTILDEVHFIDISIASSLTLIIPEIIDENYTTISFTMGLDSSKNITNLFLNENFYPSFSWPGFLGGGYHYMQLEGDFNTVFNGYATHTGATDSIDFSFNKSFPLTINESKNISDIYINMEITNWYQKPEIFNFTTNGIMEDSNSQSILQANGIEDVFSVYLIND